MYTPHGLSHTELGKFDVFPTPERLHLFHLTLPNHDVVLHAVSDDGLAWRGAPNALYCGDPGDCDDDQIWSVSVTERAGQYAMLYTALARSDEGLVQRTALATSPDLDHWAKHPGNPVAEADSRWYDSGAGPHGRVSWRDPKPVRIGNTFYAPVCAHERKGPFLRRGCVGLLVSRDLKTWEARPPLFAPRQCWDLECPQLFAIGDRWYLIASISEDTTQRYWIAPGFGGPFDVPPDGGILAPPGHYAGRIVRWRDADLYVCQRSAELDRPGFRRATGKYVAPPLAVSQREDGSLALRSFPVWDTYRREPPRPVAPDAATLYRGRPPETAGAWACAAPVGLDVLASARDARDFRLDGEIVVEGYAGGLAFGLGEQGAGHFVELRPGEKDVALTARLGGPPLAGERPFRHAAVQRGKLPRPVRSGEPIPFRLLVVANYVECSLWGEAAIAAPLAGDVAGRVGIWAEAGMVEAAGLAIAEMATPEYGVAS